MTFNHDRYDAEVRHELRKWRLDLLEPPGMFEGLSKNIQTRINEKLPDKWHKSVTAAVKGIVQSTLFTLDYLPSQPPLRGASLYESDRKAEELLSKYKKIAAAEGAGTGAGGILLGLADFPMLIGIKMKFLFELAHAYGYSARSFKERLFILYVFQLAFSSPGKKPALYETVRGWASAEAGLPSDDELAKQIDWHQLQQEYRDTIDFRKLLQLMPGIGAVVGAWANYGLLKELGRTGMNSFRLRRLEEQGDIQ